MQSNKISVQPSLVRLAFCGALASAALPLAAQEADEPTVRSVYVNGAITRISDQEFDLDAFTARVGWNMSKNFGLEAEISLPTGEDNQQFSTFELDRSIGIFPMVRAEPAKNLEIFARAGLIDARVDVEIPSQQSTFEVSQRSAAIGAGAKWYLTRNLGVRAGYTYAKSDAVDVGIEWRF
ncbi:MAG: outer membrane beta-barrel protein [Pseudomonadota bacterium]